MHLKRNVLTLALVSAGLGAVCSEATAAATHVQGDPQSAGPTASAQSEQTGSSASTAQQKATTSKAQKAEHAAKEKAITLGAIKVTGFASSIQNSIEIQRQSNSIVEAVSAEQIGKLPGTSIADALGRLPGLAVQQVNGRPQVLTIHGLGPDFSTALVNGGQQVSTANNRDVQLDQYPQSWFGSVVVHMTPSADLIGQGLAGTVDMHTIRPLDTYKPLAVVNAHYIWDGMGQLGQGPGVHDYGYHVDGVFVDQFFNHTLGVTVGVDSESSPAQIRHQAPWGYQLVGAANAGNGGLINNGANAQPGDLVVTGSKNYGISDQMRRNGLLATVQWRPSSVYDGRIDMTYDNFKEVQQLKGMELPLWFGASSVPPVPALIPGTITNGFIQNGTYENIDTVVRNDYNSTSARVYNFNWDNQFRFNENWSADVDANYSRAKRRDVLLESYSGTGYYHGPNGHGPGDTIGFSELSDGMLFVDSMMHDYTKGMVLTDPQGWGAGATPPVVQGGFINLPRTVDYLANLRASVKRSFLSGPISSVELGFDRGTRNKTYNIGQEFMIFPDGAQTAPLPAGVTFGDPLAWMGIGPQPIYDAFDLIRNGTYQLFPTSLSSISTPPNWRVHEQDMTSYVQFNLDTSIGNVGLRGNFGIQVAHTDQSTDGQFVTASAGGTNGSSVQLEPTSGGTHYTRYLPSANLVFGFTPNDDLRVSAARTIMRPRMDQMSASLGINANVTQLGSTNPNQAYFSASGGNAKLLPTEADNYNISYEHYFNGAASSFQCNSTDAKQSALCNNGEANAGYVQLSGYFLKLKDYIDPNAAFLHDFSAFIPAFLNPAQQKELGTPLGIVSGPTNDGHGYVKGLQAVLNLPLNHVTPWLDGFGVVLSGNYTKSSLVYAGNPTPITVPGLSKWVADATLYYQRGGFQARINDSYRSSFLGRVSGISATRIEQTIAGGSTYSAQVSYTLSSGRFKGLTFVLEGMNLSNHTFRTFQNNDPRQVMTWEQYGRSFELGVSYNFL